MLLIPVSLGTYLTWMLMAAFGDAINQTKWTWDWKVARFFIGLALFIAQGFVLPNGDKWMIIEVFVAIVSFPIIMLVRQIISARKAKLTASAEAASAPVAAEGNRLGKVTAAL